MPRLLRVLSLALCLSLPLRHFAYAGPLITNGAGQPLVWSTLPIPYNPDAGTLGVLDNASARQFVSDRFATWSAVSTSNISFTDAGQLPTDVTAANVGLYLGICDDHLNPIIFDTDGSIIRALLGPGNENFVLGAAGPDCGTYVPPVISEASAILNGRFIDGTSSTSNPEISLEAFAGVFTHEFGHYVGLDHSQINFAEAADGNSANDNTIATMFPILINGAEQAILNLDDEVALSMLYPAPSFFASTGSIQGAILRVDAATPFQGAYVIARSVNNPRLQAVGIASGFLFNPTAIGGPPAPNLRGYYELDGLAPGTDYTVEIEAIYPGFTGGSSVGPIDPPARVPVPEFWNGANEAATSPPDDPTEATSITVNAGVPVTGVNIIMNTAGCIDGDCLPGRGKASSECIAEWLEDPPPLFIGRPPTQLSCHDGDTCDIDGDPSNHSCTFHLALCLNNSDPRLPNCAPTDVAKVDVRTPNRNGLTNKPEDTANADALLAAIAGIGGSGVLSGTCSNLKVSHSCLNNADCDSPGKHNGRCRLIVGFAPPVATPNLCSTPAAVVVPLTQKRTGTFAAAVKRIRLRTTNSGNVTDSDTLMLRCLPGS